MIIAYDLGYTNDGKLSTIKCPYYEVSYTLTYENDLITQIKVDTPGGGKLVSFVYDGDRIVEFTETGPEARTIKSLTYNPDNDSYNLVFAGNPFNYSFSVSLNNDGEITKFKGNQLDVNSENQGIFNKYPHSVLALYFTLSYSIVKDLYFFSSHEMKSYQNTTSGVYTYSNYKRNKISDIISYQVSNETLGSNLKYTVSY